MNKLNIDIFSVLLTIAALFGASIMGFSAAMIFLLLRTSA